MKPTLEQPASDRADRPASHGSTMSPRALFLGAASAEALEGAMRRGQPPALADLVGWEFRGMNTMPWAGAARIRKFMKGFERRGGEAFGYNLAVEQGAIPSPWRALPDDVSPRRFGFYRVAPVDPTASDNRYLNSVLLDYGRGDNPRLDPSQLLRDYVVQVDPADPDLLLGKAYLRLGPAVAPVGYFVLERHRQAPAA